MQGQGAWDSGLVTATVEGQVMRPHVGESSGDGEQEVKMSQGTSQVWQTPDFRAQGRGKSVGTAVRVWVPGEAVVASAHLGKGKGGPGAE